ncbi:transcription initiation factor TFIID subunit 13 [Coccidioides immitis RS]|uniref:Transcription initiation factor TFIID subunit 13 n=3 Tax=Coccidioides immitis TaxID=5501 RepID=A0A0E1RW89_COCIM|nr:transcription initiation factor TFIID subunit 13 [Coccidioides immitis RS]EAS31654.1 transcription initiation factor TFIID subunit 13 [Coccidioides immitis RS]KMP04315.1 hypothetical protein CIRG_04006 [Coccidioides immitis RMSCC 2394]KMU73448.1 hypothetical protein CISG_03583 [Coccidioides immitis RMSCC 3703]TPX24409.1 Transcription initiation factor TFIID subunit 13 [Coccidioides immitis]
MESNDAAHHKHSEHPAPPPPPAGNWIPFPKTSKPLTFKHGDHSYAILPAPGLYEHYTLAFVNSEETAEQDLAAAAVQASGMSEPRVRLTRHHAQLNFGNELRQLLRAFGDNAPHPDFPQEPNPETVRVLDEIVTDFIIETCHAAAQVAAHAGRQKVKVDDFMFVIRRDAAKLGRVQELFQLEKELKEARKAFDQNDDRVGKDATAGKEIEGLVGSDGEGAETVVDGTSAAAGKKKGKGKKRAAGMETAASESGAGKKRKVSTVKAESTA